MYEKKQLNTGDYSPSYGEIVKRRSAFSEFYIFNVNDKLRLQPTKKNNSKVEMELEYFTENCI